MNRNILLFITGIGFIGCSHPTSVPPSARATGIEQTSIPASEAHSPFSINIIETSRTNQGAAFVVRVERRSMPNVALKGHVTPPPGVDLIGERDFDIPPGWLGTTEKSFEARYPSLPQEDIRITVDAASDGFGFHYDSAYRFGRAQPAPAAPNQAGPGFNIGGIRVNHSVPVGQGR